MDLGMVTLHDDGVIELVNWFKYQNVDGMDRVREKTRIRVQKSRNKEKQSRLEAPVALRNATVTPIDSDSEVELEKKGSSSSKKAKRKNLPPPKVQVMDRVTMLPEELEKLKAKFGEAGAAERIENISLYKGSKGVKYDSDYLTILSWERKNGAGGNGKPLLIEKPKGKCPKCGGPLAGGFCVNQDCRWYKGQTEPVIAESETKEKEEEDETDGPRGGMADTELAAF
jgi:hypothetical protein